MCIGLVFIKATVYAACGSLIQGHGNDENTERIKPDKANKRPIKLEFSW